MKKVLTVLMFAVLIGVGLAWGQDDTHASAPAADTAAAVPMDKDANHEDVDNQQVNIDKDANHEDVDNQQINKDEGYGTNDDEYNSSEGINSKVPAAQTNTEAAEPAEPAPALDQ